MVCRAKLARNTCPCFCLFVFFRLNEIEKKRLIIAIYEWAAILHKINKKKKAKKINQNKLGGKAYIVKLQMAGVQKYYTLHHPLFWAQFNNHS